MFEKSIFIFRRDLRHEDNTGLIEALKNSKIVYPIFIFNPKQIKNNPYKSQRAISFMIGSLLDLEEQIKSKGTLNFFYGENKEILEKIIKDENISAVYVNEDYTPYSIKRDEEIKKICEKNNVSFFSFADYSLHNPKVVFKEDGMPYTVFTPYARKSKSIPFDSPKKNNYSNYSKKKFSYSLDPKEFLEIPIDELIFSPGRTHALKILKQINKFESYSSKRDIPSLDATTHLSAYLKFGCVSAREVYNQVSQKLSFNHQLITQLLWRDFLYQIAYHYPYIFGGAFKKKFDKINWENDSNKLNAWKEGKTGFPIVDAAMRQLNETGFMHNRSRMIVASFLVKDLHLDWREGEKYFATKLIDYDPMINNGNWQWAASTGCDAQPYFRIFNPWSQQKRFDPDCIYIKKWVSELKDLSSKEIHAFEKTNNLSNYPKPIINHNIQSKITLDYFRRL